MSPNLRRCLLSSSMGLLICITASGQFYNLEFDIYNTEDGLSQNHVYSIVQDKQGFLWFGTDNGLNRFDGHEFKILNAQDSVQNSLPDNSIHALMVDDQGVIWIGTNNGLAKYFPETEKVERQPVDFTDPFKFNGNQVSSIKKDRRGNIWITYIGDGVDKVMPGKKEIMHYTVNRNDEYKLENDLVSSILFMPDGDVVLGTLSGLIVIGDDGKVLSLEAHKLKYPWDDLNDKSIRSLLLSDNGNTLWVGTEFSGLYRINLLTKEIQSFNNKNSRLEFNHIISLFEDSQHNIWIGSEAIYFFDHKTKNLVFYNEYGIQGNRVIKNPIYSIFEDRDRNIWLGTFRMGILKYDPHNTQILHYHTNQGEGSIQSNEILSFTEDSHNQVWVGTGGAGLYKLRKDLKGFDQAPMNSKFSAQTIKCIYKDKDDYFWLGTWDGGMMKYHPYRETLQLFHPEKKNFESLHVWAITPDSVGNLWIGTLRDGLCYFSTKTYKFKYFRNVPEDSTSLVNNDILSLLLDSRNRLWVGTGNGLSILYPESEKFINLHRNETLSNNVILCSFEDDNGRIWVGTNGGGIIILNVDLSIEKILTEKEGLPSNSITAIQYDDKKTIWISTYNGLAKIDSKNLTVSEIPQISRLQGKEFIPNSCFKSSDGNLLFGGVNGLNLFHPDSLNFDPHHERVVFTSFKILNDEVLPGKLYDDQMKLEKSITMTEELNLSPVDYSFSLSFAPLTYNWQHSLHYAYFLENFDKEWQYTTANRRFIHYTNLAPGNYTLKVKASFDGSTWPEKALELRIKVMPPWWATLWFRVSLAILLLGSLYIFYRARIDFFNKQKKKLEKIVTQRTAELKRSNEALTSKSQELEKAQSELKEMNTHLEQLVQERTQKLNHTVEELETFLYRASHDLRGPLSSMLGLLNLAKLENKQSSPFNISLKRVIMQLDRTLQKLLLKYTIQKWPVQQEVITKPELVKLLIDAERNIPWFRPDDLQVIIEDDLKFESDQTLLSILLSNLLENAFFFSKNALDPSVKFEANRNGKQVKITITDNGPGIKEEFKGKIFDMFYRGNELSKGNGLGLYLVKNVVEKMNGKIELETKEGTYSRFIFSITE